MTHFPRSTLRLFFSADIAGSTSLKSGFKSDPSITEEGKKELPRDHGVQFWLEGISKFYGVMIDAINTSWRLSTTRVPDAMQPFCNDEKTVAPYFWKGLGDEALFYTELNHPAQALFYFRVFRHAASGARTRIRRISPDIDLKCCMWLAGFPINNAELVLGSNFGLDEDGDDSDDWFYHQFSAIQNHLDANEGGGELDFIGPQMDLGFRLAKLSTPRRLVLSADLVFLLLELYEGELAKNNEFGWQVSQQESEEFEKLENQLYFSGMQELKGVLGGKRYPLIWYDMLRDDPLIKQQRELENFSHVGLGPLYRFCSVYLDQIESDMAEDDSMNKSNRHYWLHKPYIDMELADGSRARYGRPSRYHVDEFDALKTRWDLRTSSAGQHDGQGHGKPSRDDLNEKTDNLIP